MSTAGAAFGHKCFGCQRQIEDNEPHIHVGMDEWLAGRGEDGFGLDDLLTFPFCSHCSQCIEESPHGWTPESHEIEDVTTA